MRLFAFLLSFSFIATTFAKVVQVQIIHRHGARQVIDKHETDPGLEQTSPPLYPQGVEQLKNLGSYCRRQYIDESSSLSIEGISSDFNADRDVISKTSNFERTQLSARAFMSGLFPTQQEKISTLVYNGSETDWIIRGYALCPVLAKQFASFVESDSEYNQRKDDNEQFVIDLANRLGYEDKDATFENIFNIYDQYNIINSGYDTQRYNNIDKLSDSDLEKLKGLADWYESRKFRFATHKVHVAGGLLSTILGHVRSLQQSAGKRYRIVHFSAHYPTLLTLLGSIRSNSEGDVAWPADQVPGFGAALIIEVHEESGDLILRMKWFAGGDGDEEVKEVAIGRGGCMDAKAGCKVSTAERILAFDSFGRETFCRDCESDSGVCASTREIDRGDGASSANVEEEQEETGCSAGAKAASGAIGGAVGLAVGLIGSFVIKRKRAGVERGSLHDVDSGGYNGDVYA